MCLIFMKEFRSFKNSKLMQCHIYNRLLFLKSQKNYILLKGSPRSQKKKQLSCYLHKIQFLVEALASFVMYLTKSRRGRFLQKHKGEVIFLPKAHFCTHVLK